jgi:hypothetical protein
MNLYKLLLPFVSLMFFCVCMQAQTSKEYVYVDSSLLYPDAKDTVEAAPEESEYIDTFSQPVSYTTDTSLLYNELGLSGDSIRKLQHLKQFAYAKVMDSLLKELQKKQVDASNMQPEGPSVFEQFLSSPITRFVFWALACFFVLFIIYKLFFTEGFLQRQSAKAAVNLLAEDDGDVKGNTDYDKQVALAVSNKNYRLATRYLYLQAIQKLTAAGAIIFAADKTNSQYLYELAGKPYKSEFASLTLNYEYVWYGEFLIDEAAFVLLQNRFKQFNNQFRNS